ncbi:MAG: site-2 protease family protein [Chlamydiota bacterium]|nr:site-2 protease family protein [Chlamydiota bacterium]
MVEILLMVFILYFSIVLHECAHGFVALLRGDSTARDLGRLTLNPIPHIDPFGTIVLPISFFIFGGVIFAYAKPVPVNPYRLKNPKRDMMWVGAAGPVTNLLIAFIAAIFIRNMLMPGVAVNEALFYALRYTCMINLCLFLVNLLPVPPLDGSRILAGILPYSFLPKLHAIEPYGFFILILLIFAGFFEKVLWPVLQVLYKLLIGI